MTSEHTLRLTVVLDTICPWCYIGKRRMEKAIILAKKKWTDFDAIIEYAPFQLDSGLGIGLDKTEVYQKKFGTRLPEVLNHIVEVGTKEGIQFKFGGKMSNTLDSHRLIDYAKDQGGRDMQEKIVEALHHRYFELEQDVGSRDMLLAAAEDAGLNRQQVDTYLDSDNGLDALNTRMKQIRNLGVTGVPFYILNDRFGISGAESPEVILDSFAKVLEAK
ncbi:hypothetical protein H4S08_000651 [Coemansia sp. RSA 1365]|nr:hypothetical protein H4S08_000651 [Coemansia sp. RSA 1365]